MANPPNDTRLKYDTSSYQEELQRSLYPGVYSIITPHNDCDDCHQFLSNDPHLRFQSYGHHSCSMAKAVDDSSELSGRNYKNSKCSKDAYSPNSYISTGCVVKTTDEIRKCSTPTESCRLSNPPCNLKETGINRFDPLCWNPQEKAIETFDRIGVNNRTLMKDNHIPLVETPDDNNKFMPNKELSKNNSNDLDKWATIHKDNKNYSPGYPFNKCSPYAPYVK